MLIGHYAPAFMIKALDKKVPLWGLFIAVQVADIIWATLILLGIEKAGINTEALHSPLVLSYMPYSHGLLSAICYSLAGVGLLLLFPYFRKNKQTAWLLGLAIFSHWIIDFISHRPDLPVYGNSMKVGLGLWNYPAWSKIIEAGMYVLGAAWYAYAVQGFKRWAAWLFWIFILASTLSSTLRSETMGPGNIHSVAISALTFYFFATLVIFIVEKNEKE